MYRSFHKYILLLLAATLTGCSSDDNPQVTSLTDADVVGQWVLVELNSNPNIDIGNDGTTDTNLMLQTTCFDGWGLDFDANGTLTTNSSDIEIDPNAIATLICTPRTDTGNYVVSGNDITVSTTVDGVVESETVTISITNNTMTILGTESDVAGLFNIPDGEFYSNLMSIEFVLQKI